MIGLSRTPGTRVGPYEIVALLGAGGMGEVYRATDTHLDRHVAVKVLPESFALGADRVARFTREARTLAALNHPNIGAIYGLEKTADLTAHELLFFDDNQVWFAPHSVVGDAFSPGTPQLWSPASIRGLGTTSNFDPHPDGKRVAAAAEQVTVQDHVVVLSNIVDYLRTIAPVKK